MECIEGVGMFKYLGRILDQLEENWTEARKNIRKAHRFWDRLDKLLRREGAEPFVSAHFYWAVLQEVLLFGADTWVMLEAMTKTL